MSLIVTLALIALLAWFIGLSWWMWRQNRSLERKLRGSEAAYAGMESHYLSVIAAHAKPKKRGRSKKPAYVITNNRQFRTA